ncbi:MAG: adenosine deaminase [Alphaproteobacteria bacterium]|jgi:adenosine deaminase|nr:adenosine deaminase [Alphaproteobacteria bacterium]MDP6517926.1 adenosine deaminase [Alphaproteobacteria bacterium]
MRGWLERLPKAELHLHLEGAIPLDTLWALIEKYGGDASVPTRAALERRLTYPDFPAFIEAWLWKNRFLREYEDFTFIAEAVARDLGRQNIRYAEMFFSPSRFTDQGLSPQGLAQAIRRGLDKVAATEVWLIADLVRDLGADRAARTLAQVAEVRDCGIVGIGIGGSEHLCPPEPFAPVYAQARRLGFRTSAHAGEAAGAESVRGAIVALAVDRVGHATRAEEDPAVLDLLAARRIPLELCPLSNLATGVIADVADHPVRRYWERGLILTINTDDPGMFANSLAGEYALLHEVFGFTAAEIRTLVLNALDAAWRPRGHGPRLWEIFTADPGWSWSGGDN